MSYSLSSKIGNVSFTNLDVFDPFSSINLLKFDLLCWRKRGVKLSGLGLGRINFGVPTFLGLWVPEWSIPQKLGLNPGLKLLGQFYRPITKVINCKALHLQFLFLWKIPFAMFPPYCFTFR